MSRIQDGKTTNGINHGKGKEIYFLPDEEVVIDKGVGELIFEEMITHKDKVFQIDAITGEEETYAQVLSNSIRVSQNLKKRGIAPGDILSLCCYNNMHYTSTVLATFFIGAVNAPMDPTSPLLDFAHCLRITEPKVIFIDAELEDVIEEAVKQSEVNVEIVVFGETKRNTCFFEFLKELEPEASFKVHEINDFFSSACIHFSSGTTGLPKACCVTHYGLLFVSYGFKRENFGPLVSMVVTSPFWISNMNTLISDILNGNTRITVKKFDEETILKHVEQYKINMLLITPVNGAKLLTNPRYYEGYDLSSLKILLTGGSPTPPQQILEYMKIFSKETFIVCGYGMTETGGLVVRPYIQKYEEVVNAEKVIVGTPMPGYRYKLVDPETEELCGPYQEGELRLIYPGVMKEYYRNPKAYAEAFDSEGFLKTGDIVFHDNDYRFYYINRSKEIFKYLGWHISPIIIETELLKHPNIKHAIVFGVPTKAEGDYPTAAVILKDNSKFNEKEILTFIKERLPDRYQLRGGIYIIDNIPATSTGKIQRRKLTDMVSKLKNNNTNMKVLSFS